MLEGTKASHLQFWLDLKSNQDSLLSPTGTSIWQEGLELLNSLSVSSFFKFNSIDSQHEQKAFVLLNDLYDRVYTNEEKNFDIIGDYQLKKNSDLYRFLSMQAKDDGIIYQFSLEPEGDFKPWTNQIILGQNFFKTHKNRIKVPFYSINHEHAHLCLFGSYYSNIQISDSELSRLFILIEWFCISLDLILAFDLINAGAIRCLAELETITHISRTEGKSFFAKNSRSLKQINTVANLFRNSFLNREKNDTVDEIISFYTLAKHTTYANEDLLRSSRNTPSQMTPEEARNLSNLLASSSLTEIIRKLTGIVYE